MNMTGPAGAGPGEMVRASRRRFRTGPVDGAFALAVTAAITPIVVATARAVARGWLPVGDAAYTAIRGRDVLGGHVPLLGTWSSATFWAHRQLNHPGPLQFDMAAIPVRLFGPGAGVAVATAAVNALAVLTVAWLARRMLGSLAATMVALFIAGLLWAMGSELMFDAWSQYAPLLPFLAFLFAVWAVAAGRGAAWPALVIAGSYALQTHLSYSLLVPGLAVWATVGWFLGLRTTRRTDPDGWARRRGGQLAWGAAGLVCLAVLWAQPLYQQLTGDRGNLSELGRSALAKGPPSPGARGALQAVGTMVGMPPFWLPPTWARTPFWSGRSSDRPLLLLGVVLAGLICLGAGAAWLARRAGDRTSVAGLLTAGFAVGLAFLSVAKARSSFGLITASYVRWLWPVSLFTWSVLLVAAARVVQRTGRLPARPRLRVAAGGALAAVTVLVAILALPSANRGSSSIPWAIRATRQVSRQAVPLLKGHGPVLVVMQSTQSFAVGPALLFELQRAGIPFVVNDRNLASQLGQERRFDGTNARTLISVVGPEGAANPPAGYRRIAYSPGLDAANHRLLLRLDAQVRARIRLVHRVSLLRSELDQLRPVFRAQAEEKARRARNGDEMALSDLVRQKVVDRRAFGPVDLRRWVDLGTRWREQTAAVLIGPVPTRGLPPVR